MKKLKLLFLLLLATMSANAQVLYLSEVQYAVNVNTNEAVVVESTGIPYQGSISIPGTFEYSGDITDNKTMMFTVRGIAAGAFKDSDITSIYLPNTLQYIGDYAFENTRIQTFSIPEGVVTIGKGIISNCNYVFAINIPSTVTTIADGAFDNTNLANITVSENNPKFSAENNILFNPKIRNYHPIHD